MLIERGGTEGLLVSTTNTFLLLSLARVCSGYSNKQKRKRERRRRIEQENKRRKEAKTRFLIELTEDQIRQNPPGECKRCLTWKQDRCMELEDCQFCNATLPCQEERAVCRQDVCETPPVISKVSPLSCFVSDS